MRKPRFLFTTFCSSLSIILVTWIAQTARVGAATLEPELTQPLILRVQAETTDEYIAVSRKIRSFAINHDLSGLSTYADSLVTTWQPKAKPDDYLAAFNDVCLVLNSYDFHDEAQYKVAGRYASLLLTRWDTMPLALRLSFVIRLLNNRIFASLPPNAEIKYSENLPPGTPADKRLGLCLEVLGQLDSRIDPNFDINNAPPKHVSMSPGPGLMLGADASAITDPELRTKYEAAVQELRAKREAYNLQWYLGHLDSEMGPVIERACVNITLKQHLSETEFTQIINLFHITAKRRDRILMAFRSATGQQSLERKDTGAVGKIGPTVQTPNQ